MKEESKQSYRKHTKPWKEMEAEEGNMINENFPNQGKETDIQVGSTESPKQEQPKEDNTGKRCN